MELWDVFDSYGKRTGKLIRRGDKLQTNEYHLVVNVWIKNADNKFLISKRSPYKTYLPNIWESTSGAVLSNESSLDAAIREVNEELGITLDRSNGYFLYRIKRKDFNAYVDVWMFEEDIKLKTLSLQVEEVADVKLADELIIRKMVAEGSFDKTYSYLDIILKIHKGYPDLIHSTDLLDQGNFLNPGKWSEHSKYVAIACKNIAYYCDNLEEEKAYVLGLLHDIGRQVGKVNEYHTIAGYKYLLELGYIDVAKICISHSYPIKDISTAVGKMDMNIDDYILTNSIIENIEYNDYDLLVQLCDALALPTGFCILEKRFIDIARRYGISKYTIQRWDKLFEIKAYFERKINKSIYSILPGIEINTFN